MKDQTLVPSPHTWCTDAYDFGSPCCDRDWGSVCTLSQRPWINFISCFPLMDGFGVVWISAHDLEVFCVVPLGRLFKTLTLCLCCPSCNLQVVMRSFPTIDMQRGGVGGETWKGVLFAVRARNAYKSYSKCTFYMYRLEWVLIFFSPEVTFKCLHNILNRLQNGNISRRRQMVFATS